MPLGRFILNYLRSHSIPILKSFFKAYRDTTANARSQQSAGGKKHPLDDYFKSMLSKTNLSAPPLDAVTALRILNIETEADKQLDPKYVLERYYTLYKKNDPVNGGTVYLQSKVFSAKQCIMQQFPNAPEIQQEFYKEVVEPEEKAAKEAQQAKKQQSQEKQTAQEKKK